MSSELNHELSCWSLGFYSPSPLLPPPPPPPLLPACLRTHTHPHRKRGRERELCDGSPWTDALFCIMLKNLYSSSCHNAVKKSLLLILIVWQQLPASFNLWSFHFCSQNVRSPCCTRLLLLKNINNVIHRFLKCQTWQEFCFELICWLSSVSLSTFLMLNLSVAVTGCPLCSWSCKLLFLVHHLYIYIFWPYIRVSVISALPTVGDLYEWKHGF